MASSSTNTTSSDTPRRVGTRDKHKQVIDAAVELFLTNGFDQTSMESIAARAGVSKTTVYAHYADKLALFKAVVGRTAKSLAVELSEERVQEADSTEARLTYLILSVLEATAQPAFRAFLRVMISESARRPDLAYAAEAARLVDAIGLIASTLEDEAAQHGYQLSDPRMFATVLLRMAVSGPQLDSLMFAEFRPDHALLDAHARWITAIFLRGIEPRTGDSLEVTPPADCYEYPWLPDTGSRRAGRPTDH